MRFHFRSFLAFCCLAALSSCASFFAGRPAQEMSDTAAAMRAAREVQAPLLSPVLYERAREYWDRSKRFFKFKDFENAKFFAQRAKRLAEEAEFESVCCRGGKRNAVNIKDPLDEEIRSETEAAGPGSSQDAGLLEDVTPQTPNGGYQPENPGVLPEQNTAPTETPPGAEPVTEDPNYESE